jgi:hypothetical protein
MKLMRLERTLDARLTRLRESSKVATPLIGKLARQ